MAQKIQPGSLLGAVAVVLLLGSAAGIAAETEWPDYAGVLKRHTRSCLKKGIRITCLNYNGVRSDPAWSRVLHRVAAGKPGSMGGRERLAFYINAYNILAINTIVSHSGVAGVNSVPNVWKRGAGVVGGRSYSLDALEKGVIKRFGDPLYHFALVCAAVSCPDLRAEPYTGSALGRQLHQQTSAFLNNPGKGVALMDGARANVSRLFDWYKAEFARVGGTDAFVLRYVKAYRGHSVVGFLPYHWELNGP